MKLLCVYGKKMEISKEEEQDEAYDSGVNKMFTKFTAERDELLRVM